uniref:Uncharacterized protein n=1 Tax=Phytophthora ramorum TaxID=164328 RepID=H3GWQ6_PHYRM
MAETSNTPVPAPSSMPAASGDSTQPPPASASSPSTGDVETRPLEDPSQLSGTESQAIVLRQPEGGDSAENAPDESKDAGGGGVSPIPMGEGVVLPSFSRPRHVRMEDVDALFFKGVLSQQTIRPETFAPPDASARWTLPSLPDTGTKTYLVGVPATVDDTRGGGFTMNGYGGTTALIGFEEMNADDNSEFERLFDMDARQYLLQARQDPLRLDALTSSLDDIGTRREFASILTHFPPDQLASRIERGQEATIKDALEFKRINGDLRREWKFVCAHWHQEVTSALAKANEIKASDQDEVQALKSRYQDQIDALEAEKSELKARVDDAETQVGILKKRLDDSTMDPWTLSAFMQKRADVSGNWDRLHDLFVHCVNGCVPPSAWDTVVNITAMDQRKAPIPTFPAFRLAVPVPKPPVSNPVILDLTNLSGIQESKSHSGGKSPQRSHTPKSLKKTKSPKVQRRPSTHHPGRDSVRKAGEKTTISKEAACKMLPGRVIWKEVRPDVRQIILAGIKYETAMRCLDQDKPAHGFFRQPQLVKMLVSMMYWRRLDLTPWARYVPTTYYKMADERLDRKLRRGEVPPSWGNLDDHTIVYRDSETESVVDDKELDPDYAPPAQEVEDDDDSESSSSEDEEDSEPKKSKTSGVESGSKRPHISSSDDSDEAPVTSRRKDHKRLRLDSRSGHKSKSKAKKSLKSSGNRPSRHRSRLARREYDSLTAAELMTIETPDDDETSWRHLGILVHGRVTRRNALRRRYQSLVKRALATPGFVKTLLYEPGLWKLPDRCCAWIWQDPRVEKLGGPKCDDLEIQLAETDLREPARTQWNTASSKSEWLQYVPTELKARMLSASERKENLICTK